MGPKNGCCCREVVAFWRWSFDYISLFYILYHTDFYFNFFSWYRLNMSMDRRIQRQRQDDKHQSSSSKLIKLPLCNLRLLSSYYCKNIALRMVSWSCRQLFLKLSLWKYSNMAVLHNPYLPSHFQDEPGANFLSQTEQRFEFSTVGGRCVIQKVSKSRQN